MSRLLDFHNYVAAALGVPPTDFSLSMNGDSITVNHGPVTKLQIDELKNSFDFSAKSDGQKRAEIMDALIEAAKDKSAAELKAALSDSKAQEEQIK